MQLTLADPNGILSLPQYPTTRISPVPPPGPRPGNQDSPAGQAKLQLLRSISRSSDDPFMVCDLRAVYDRFCLWREKLPRVHPFYAVKCNDDPKLLQLLARLGAGFDCASKGEIGKVVEMGVSPGRIIYANPCKQNSHLKYAAGQQVSLMTFDCEGEVRKVKKVFDNPRLVLRIATDDSQSVCQLGMKFGAPLAHCGHLLQVAKDAGCQVLGLSFHVGSGCLDASAYDKAIKDSAVVLALAERLGHSVSLLDIGGGFPGVDSTDTKLDHTSFPSFAEIASVINRSLEQHIVPRWPRMRVMAEPGRFFATAAFTLATAVISVKQPQVGVALPDTAPAPAPHQLHSDRDQEHGAAPAGDGVLPRCYVNDGVYGSFNCLLYDHAQVAPRPLEESAGGAECECVWSVWGPSCDGLDRVSPASLLPATLQPGHWLYWEHMGAYTISAASTFNGFPTPTLHYYHSNGPLTLEELEGAMLEEFSLGGLKDENMRSESGHERCRGGGSNSWPVHVDAAVAADEDGDRGGCMSLADDNIPAFEFEEAQFAFPNLIPV